MDVDGELVKLEEVSPLIKALKLAEMENWRLGVYTKREYVEKVSKIASKLLNLDKIPKQKTLDEIS